MLVLKLRGFKFRVAAMSILEIAGHSIKLIQNDVGVDASRSEGAPVGGLNLRGESPRRGFGMNLVIEGNCVVVRRGGEQPEVNC